jgi:hypothetical protein
MPGWQFVESDARACYWGDASGDAVRLALLPEDPTLPAPENAIALRTYCRRYAQQKKAGLLEVACTHGAEGTSCTFVCKRLEIPAFTFFGVILIPNGHSMWQWLVIAGERGTTGIREAVVAAKMLEAGQLTIETYASSWACDPYEPSYAGVDRSTLRYLSDSEEYDEEFPDHPLTKVRRELRRLLHVRLSNTAA